MAPIPKEEYCVRIGPELKSGAFWRDAFSELVATFFLVAVQILLLQDWQANPNPQALAIQVSIGMALVAAAVGYGLGDFGGAHMNCAVTLALTIRAEISIVKAFVYWIMQCAGGIAAGFFVYAISPADVVGNLGNTTLGENVEWWQGLIMELFLTLMLCLTALGTQNIARKGYIILPSIPVGFALGLGLFLGLPYTGGSLNPARSLGPAVASSVMMGDDSIWSDHWIYWAGPQGGALVAAILYWIFDSVEKPKMGGVYDHSNTWMYSKSVSKERLDPNGDGIYPSAMLQ